MALPYLLRRMLRRKKLCVVVWVIAFVTSALLYGFHVGDRVMDRQIEDVLDNSVVTCAVTNLTGTQSDYLELLDWTVSLFQRPTEHTVHVPETSFLDYVKDIQIKVSTKGSIFGQKVDVLGITALEADRSYFAQENTIVWLGGYDETVFSGDAAACVVSEDIYRSFCAGDGGSEDVLLVIVGKYNEKITTELELTVAGICNGKQTTVYCPWETAIRAYRTVNGTANADCIYATITDNRRIEEFKERCASEYFAEVDPKGQPQLWEKSPIYEYYPYAFAIYDETMNQTLASLRRNQSIFRLCQKLIVVLTLGTGFVIGNLTTKQRQRELALQYVLGLPGGRIFTEVWVEHLTVCGTGIVLAIMVLLILFWTAPPWGYLLAAFGANCLGVAAAAAPVLINDDILLQVKRGD